MWLRPREGTEGLFPLLEAFSPLQHLPVARAEKGLSQGGKAPVESGKGRTGSAGPKELKLA